MRSRRLSKGTAPDDDDVLSDDEPSVSDIDSNSSDGDGGRSDDSDASEDSGSRRGHRKFVMPPPREALPERTTRGKRMGALAVPEDDDADNEFWNQEFFAEEAADERYETESEPEDHYDQDFNDTEEDDDEDELVEEIEDRNDFEATKKKVLKPPGSKKPPVKKKAPVDPSEPKAQKKSKVVPERTMSVRSSTKEKVEQARAERKFIEETKGKRAYRRADHKQLTQAELLAEAARTAIENTRSLMYMEAVEEENKRRATSSSGKYVGPMVSFASSKGDDGMEHSVVRIKHMSVVPEYLQPKVLPPVAQKDVCPITKTVAKYRDPVTGTPYSTLEAFRQIRAKAGR